MEIDKDRQYANIEAFGFGVVVQYPEYWNAVWDCLRSGFFGQFDNSLPSLEFQILTTAANLEMCVKT